MLLTLEVEGDIFIFPLTPKSLPGNDSTPTVRTTNTGPTPVKAVAAQEPTGGHATAALTAPRPAKGRNWQVGKVLDAQRARTFIHSGSTTESTPQRAATRLTNTDSWTTARTLTIKETELLTACEE